MNTTPDSPTRPLPPLKLGCIGCGNMGGALLRGLALLPELTICAHDHNPARVDALASLGVKNLATPAEVAREAQILLIAVKPVGVRALIDEILPLLTPGHLVLSAAAGITTASLKSAVDDRCPVVRFMPNTPAVVGMGTYALCLEDPLLSADQKAMLPILFDRLGKALVLPEAKFSAFTALVGCGPAYVAYFMDSLVEAGVTLGFPRRQATDLVSWLFAGTARMASQPGAHPALLREDVCSPAGVTIAGTNRLDRDAVRGRIVAAVQAAYARDRELSSS